MLEQAKDLKRESNCPKFFYMRRPKSSVTALKCYDDFLRF